MVNGDTTAVATPVVWYQSLITHPSRSRVGHGIRSTRVENKTILVAWLPFQNELPRFGLPSENLVIMNIRGA